MGYRGDTQYVFRSTKNSTVTVHGTNLFFGNFTRSRLLGSKEVIWVLLQVRQSRLDFPVKDHEMILTKK